MGDSRILKGREARILSAVLILQGAVFYGISRRENAIPARPLAEFPAQVAAWRLAQEGVVEKETMDVLRADDVLTRTYADGSRFANLFVAFFKSQRTGQAPHSPKNCLPGSGWTPSESTIVPLTVPGRASPVRINRYVVAKGEQQSVVLYWYQSRDRVVASEYAAKVFVVADAIRYNRTDTALVRVVVPVVGKDVAGASATAEDFVRTIFQPLRQLLPA